MTGILTSESLGINIVTYLQKNAYCHGKNANKHTHTYTHIQIDSIVIFVRVCVRIKNVNKEDLQRKLTEEVISKDQAIMQVLTWKRPPIKGEKNTTRKC